MTLTEKLLAIWAASPSAIALVPASRFKPQGDWQNIQAPYIIHQGIVGSMIQTHNSNGAMVALRTWNVYQFSIHAPSFSVADAVAETLYTVFNGNIDGVQFLCSGPRSYIKDEETGTGMLPVDFQISHNSLA